MSIRLNKQFMLPIVILILTAAVLLSACSQKSGELQPPKINYGRDMCDRCGMIIGDARFASATLLMDGKYLKFDDLGEMLAYHRENPDVQVAAWFVHDYPSETWIRGETAFYVFNQDFQTPMGFGIAAFKEHTEAEKFAAEHKGIIYNLEEVHLQAKMMKKPMP
jgi:copper chaperone NosL